MEHTAKQYGLPLPGEIDALVVDEHRRVWVCETKDIGRSVSPWALRGRVRDYIETYIPKLRAKVHAIETGLPAVRKLLGLPREAPLEVYGVFVTRVVEPAAFLRSSDALFCVIDDFADLLASDNAPAAGHFEVGQGLSA
jgi:hypothetical protein